MSGLSPGRRVCEPPAGWFFGFVLWRGFEPAGGGIAPVHV
jgi:hypothetical protein